jgi:hypothetical protein
MSILNGSILILWTGFLLFSPDLVYRTQSIWFSISREKFTVIMYSFLGLFKLLYETFARVGCERKMRKNLPDCGGKRSE